MQAPNTETCVCVCLGNDMTCTETTREANHKALYGVNGLNILFSIIWLAISAGVISETFYMLLFPKIKMCGIINIVLSVLLFLLSILGIAGTHARNKVAIMWWLLLMAGLLATELIFSINSMGYFTPEEYAINVDSEYLLNWELLVETAKSEVADELAEKPTLDWLQATQVAGACCGWLDAESESENPDLLDCNVDKYDLTCGEYFELNLDVATGGFESIALTFAILSSLMGVASFALVCRLKEFYQSEQIDYGDFIKVPFNQVKNVDDLIK